MGDRPLAYLIANLRQDSSAGGKSLDFSGRLLRRTAKIKALETVTRMRENITTPQNLHHYLHITNFVLYIVSVSNFLIQINLSLV